MRVVRRVVSRTVTRRHALSAGGFTLIETVIVALLVGVFATIGLYAVDQTHRPAAHATCADDRRTLDIAITAYRSRFGPKADPTRFDLKTIGLIATAENAYTYTYLEHVPQFAAVSGSGCR